MKILRLSYFIVFVFVSLSSFANVDLNNSLSGRVLDYQTHKPLINANLYIADLRLWAITDGEGKYKFDNLPSGNFTVEVSFIGYKSYVELVKIGSNTLKDFYLQSSVVEIENVIITGVSSATQIKRSPLQVSVISRQEIEKSAGSNLLDALSKTAGFSAVTTGPAIAKPFIRGLGYNRVVSINDGIRQEGQQWGDEHGLEVDEYSAQKIELLRGPASLMFGSDAIGGVLNILTNVPIPNNLIRANLSGTFNTNNNLLGSYANIAGNLNGINWNLYGSQKEAGDYKNKFDGKVLNSRFNEMNYGGYVGINKNWGFSHFIFSAFNQKLGMIEGERNEKGEFVLDGYASGNPLMTSKTPLVPNQKVNHLKLALDNSFSFGNSSRLTALLGFQQNGRQEFGEIATPDEPEIYLKLNTINYNIIYHPATNSGWKTSFGINGMSQRNSNKAEEAIIPDYHVFDFGVFGYGSKNIKSKTTLSGGLRFDIRNLKTKEMGDEDEIKFESLKREFSNVSGSLGISHEINEIFSVKANISRGFRAPNVSELSAHGKHEGTYRYELGNKNLKIETSFSVDGSVQVETKHLSLSIAPFFNRINNYIYYEKILNNAGADSLIAQTPVYRFTQQSAEMWGLDVNFDLHPHPLDWLHFENTLSYLRGRFTKEVGGSRNMPLIAPLRLLTALRAEFSDGLKFIKNFYIKLEMDNVAAQNHFFAGYNTETATPGYTLFNSGLGGDVAVKGRKTASLFLSVNNITNLAYQNHLSRLKYLDENPLTKRPGVFNMGRNFSVRMMIPLEWKVKNS